MNLSLSGLTTTIVISPFWEEVGPSCKACPPHLGTQLGKLGDLFNIGVSTTGGVSTAYVQDVTTPWTFTSPAETFTPNTQSAEWVAECRTCDNGKLMAYLSPVSYSSPGVNGASISLAGPVVASIDQITDGGHYFHLVPTYLVSANGFSKFDVLYHNNNNQQW